jgi:glycosyltransferase involved in cell wall biosynthesis
MNMNSEGVVMLGEVKDAAAFIKSKAIMPVPLFSGSGMRVKIVEAMMLEKAIVSTSIGIEGIQHTHGKDVLIANSADEFITQISRLLDDKHLFNSICSQAKINVSQQFSNEVLTAKLIRFFRSL